MPQNQSFQIMDGPLYTAHHEKPGEEGDLANYELSHQQIIIFMGTVTVISFILVISLSTVIFFIL